MIRVRTTVLATPGELRMEKVLRREEDGVVPLHDDVIFCHPEDEDLARWLAGERNQDLARRLGYA